MSAAALLTVQMAITAVVPGADAPIPPPSARPPDPFGPYGPDTGLSGRFTAATTRHVAFAGTPATDTTLTGALAEDARPTGGPAKDDSFTGGPAKDATLSDDRARGVILTGGPTRQPDGPTARFAFTGAPAGQSGRGQGIAALALATRTPATPALASRPPATPDQASRAPATPALASRLPATPDQASRAPATPALTSRPPATPIRASRVPIAPVLASRPPAGRMPAGAFRLVSAADRQDAGSGAYGRAGGLVKLLGMTADAQTLDRPQRPLLHAHAQLPHRFAADQLRAAGIKRRSTGRCASKHRPNCTSYTAIRAGTVAQLIRLKRRSKCPIVVTGGTETGHAHGRHSHGSGYKVDIAPNACIDAYIKRTYKRVGTRHDGAALYSSGNTARSDIFARERDHWDITFR